MKTTIASALALGLVLAGAGLASPTPAKHARRATLVSTPTPKAEASPYVPYFERHPTATATPIQEVTPSTSSTSTTGSSEVGGAIIIIGGIVIL